MRLLRPLALGAFLLVAVGGLLLMDHDAMAGCPFAAAAAGAPCERPTPLETASHHLHALGAYTTATSPGLLLLVAPLLLAFALATPAATPEPARAPASAFSREEARARAWLAHRTCRSPGI